MPHDQGAQHRVYDVEYYSTTDEAHTINVRFVVPLNPKDGKPGSIKSCNSRSLSLRERLKKFYGNPSSTEIAYHEAGKGKQERLVLELSFADLFTQYAKPSKVILTVPLADLKVAPFASIGGDKCSGAHLGKCTHYHYLVKFGVHVKMKEEACKCRSGEEYRAV